MTTRALTRNGLLDEDGYLLPPEHIAVKRFTKRFFQLTEMHQLGTPFTPEEKLRLKEMQIAFDYYQEALDDEYNELQENSDDDSELGESEAEEVSDGDISSPSASSIDGDGDGDADLIEDDYTSNDDEDYVDK